MSRKGSKCVSFSPDVLEKPIEKTNPDKGNKGRSKKSKGKPGGRMRNRLCIPRLKGSNLSPMRILERFRDVLVRAVFSSCSKNGSYVRKPSTMKSYAGHLTPDSHYTEAIADCIEFFKKSSCTEQKVS